MSGLSNELTFLILEERKARAALDPTAPKRKRVRNARRYWSAVEALLNHLSREVPAIRHLEVADTLNFLALQAGYLGAGVVPEPAGDVAVRGNPPAGPTEKRDRAIAVAYRKACEPTGLQTKRGVVRIEDASPTQTLADWFNVLPRTIQKWVSEAGDLVSLPIEVGDRTDIDILAQEAGTRFTDHRSKSNDRRANKPMKEKTNRRAFN